MHGVRHLQHHAGPVRSIALDIGRFRSWLNVSQRNAVLAPDCSCELPSDREFFVILVGGDRFQYRLDSTWCVRGCPVVSVTSWQSRASHLSSRLWIRSSKPSRA